MVKSYLDESSDERKEQVFAIAGFIATEDQWLAHEILWNEKTKDLKDPFHMNECECGRGQFHPDTGWKKSDSISLITGLVDVIVSRKIYGFGSSVVIPDFKSVFPNESLDSLYFLCFRHCIIQMASWGESFKEKVGFIFDRQKEFQYKAHELYTRMSEINWKHKGRLGSLTFEYRGDFIPLQAADLLAYETFKAVRNPLHHPTVKPRKSLERIAATRRYAVQNWTRPALETVAQQIKELNYKTLMEYLMVLEIPGFVSD